MRMNISVPDALAEQVRARDLPISAICQEALRDAVERAAARERARENVTSGIAAVVERLRGTIDDRDRERLRSDRELREEGRDDGVAWARDYATAAELKYLASYGSGRGREKSVPLRSLFAFLSDKRNEKVTHIPVIKAEDPYWGGFIGGAGEVWNVVADRLR
ncbi:type II toxin-antitoxin system CcdA family antitoxin [Streptomyces sp. TRM 70361]|uniref:type II toxin-antitoxin system CcdA family antitoxin n=1 Tax=Streptomyces sp. TRM 70361 TaxID=3116553 RepID=UPI002E7B93DC|nr:type II toxin-antitoxin system CcdA family antitoxin [Streptomyces sp. TRM 70361]MEE1941708.1 type II toxin-antitoxin system CcdA family antitoxin [Streptomyces sp. TRM 70361]